MGTSDTDMSDAKKQDDKEEDSQADTSMQSDASTVPSSPRTAGTINRPNDLSAKGNKKQFDTKKGSTSSKKMKDAGETSKNRNKARVKQHTNQAKEYTDKRSPK